MEKIYIDYGHGNKDEIFDFDGATKVEINDG